MQRCVGGVCSGILPFTSSPRPPPHPPSLTRRLTRSNSPAVSHPPSLTNAVFLRRPCSRRSSPPCRPPHAPSHRLPTTPPPRSLRLAFPCQCRAPSGVPLAHTHSPASCRLSYPLSLSHTLFQLPAHSGRPPSRTPLMQSPTPSESRSPPILYHCHQLPIVVLSISPTLSDRLLHLIRAHIRCSVALGAHSHDSKRGAPERHVHIGSPAATFLRDRTAAPAAVRRFRVHRVVRPGRRIRRLSVRTLVPIFDTVAGVLDVAKLGASG